MNDRRRLRATFNARRDAALALMDAHGVKRSSAAPPLHRLLWRVGVRIPPPPMASFALNAALMGVAFGVLWGLAMWLCAQQVEGLPGVAAIATVGVPLAGLMFGVTMALVFRRLSRRHGLPHWRDIDP